MRIASGMESHGCLWDGQASCRRRCDGHRTKKRDVSALALELRNDVAEQVLVIHRRSVVSDEATKRAGVRPEPLFDDNPRQPLLAESLGRPDQFFGTLAELTAALLAHSQSERLVECDALTEQ